MVGSRRLRNVLMVVDLERQSSWLLAFHCTRYDLQSRQQGSAQHLTSLGQKPRFPKPRVLEGGARVLDWDWKWTRAGKLDGDLYWSCMEHLYLMGSADPIIRGHGKGPDPDHARRRLANSIHKAVHCCNLHMWSYQRGKPSI